MMAHKKGTTALKPAARRQARHYALQAIYAWQLSENHMSDIEAQFLSQNDFQQADIPYFRDLLAGVALHYSNLDQAMMPYLTLTRSIDQLGPVEKAILRLALYELTQRQDVPYKVVINEAIELAKSFGAQESHKFINGVLDKTVLHLRSA